ncbi:cation channel sperm-associated targeting subunit tau-like [Branchiostoma lanceolatum]|uniref:cation channel sperm-associated targeting subunit tau-like n=1 Tax=Branchiostoma lanceolatum TaxID=7740 RepID=UPI003451A006
MISRQSRDEQRSSHRSRKKAASTGISGLYSEDKDAAEKEPIACSPSGLLGIHLKTCKKIAKNLLYPNPRKSGVFVSIKVGETTKYSKVARIPDAKNQDVIVFDDLKHFPIELHRERDHAQNKVCIRAFTWDGTQPEPSTVGTATLHLFDIVKQMFMSEDVQLQWKHHVSGELELEICFVYGTYGYGQSHQLEQYDQEVKEILNHSMFCRLAPPEQRVSKHGHCELLSSLPIGPPSFIPFETTVDIGNGRDLTKGSCHSVLEQEYPEATTVLAAIKGRRRLHKLKKQLSKLHSGKERTNFLHDLVDEPKVNDPKNKYWAAAESSFDATEVVREEMADFLRSAPGLASRRRAERQASQGSESSQFSFKTFFSTPASSRRTTMEDVEEDSSEEDGEGSVLFTLLRRAWDFTVGRFFQERGSRRVQPAMELHDVPVVKVADE